MDIDSDVQLLAALLFSETKNIEDAKGVANVVINRTKRPNRFGANLFDVITAPSQFSGVNTPEWDKALDIKNQSESEQKLYKQYLAISSSALRGTLKDTTNGADHYANLKLVKPEFSKVYPKTVVIDQHTYFKEPTPAGKKAK